MKDGATIMVVNPNTTRSMTDEIVAAAAAVTRSTTRLIGSTAATGVAAVETNAEEVWGALSVLEQVRQGEIQGVDGYVIACFGDTGLAGARETAAGPVVGMTEAALFAAALVAPRFGIVTLPPRTQEQSRRALRETGMTHRAGVYAIEANVAAAADNSHALFDALFEQSRRAIDEDAAEAIVLGCAGLTPIAEPLSQRLGVPVIDGVLAAVTMVEGLLAQGLSTSRLSTYAVATNPPEQP
jgi:allantoin racemase